MFLHRRELKKTMNIPVFHDDQHGTAIISSAALLNALHAGREEDRRDPDRGQRRRGLGQLLRQAGHRPGRQAEQHDHVRHQGGHLQGAHRGDESLQGAVCRRYPVPHPGRGGGRGRCPVRPLGQGGLHPRDGGQPGPRSDHLRHGQPGPGDHPGRGPCGAERRHHGHRPLRLSQPGEQRPRLSLHLPGRPGLCAPPASTKR